MLRIVLLLFAALCGTLACTPSLARPLVEIDVIDRDTGEWLPEYRHRSRSWIAGQPGHRYAVRLTNRSDRRVLVVLSVDGVNAVTGQTAHPSQAGYVLAPWQSTEVSGWRKSYDDVAQFVFTDLPDSYAARTGRADHVGVIGIAVFEERVYPRYHDTPAIARERSAPAAPAAAESAADATAQGLGTGHGAREWAPVGRTTFERASRTPAQVTELRYDDELGLAARGVLPRWTWPRREPEPRAFPGGFVPDP
ncbi:MAG TPA: hypothetical protein VEY50_04535 [Lysobacter sp.]|nr:hypothetical protein [Lysobacter sp.]